MAKISLLEATTLALQGKLNLTEGKDEENKVCDACGKEPCTCEPEKESKTESLAVANDDVVVSIDDKETQIIMGDETVTVVDNTTDDVIVDTVEQADVIEEVPVEEVPVDDIIPQENTTDVEETEEVEETDVEETDVEETVKESKICEASSKHYTMEEFTKKMRDAVEENKILKGVIVFTEDSFDTPYTVEERSYQVDNENSKYFDVEKLGNSLYGDCLDGKDLGVRLDNYLDDWDVDYCYFIDEAEKVEESNVQKDYDEKLKDIFNDYQNQGMTDTFFTDLVNVTDISTDAIDKWYATSFEELTESKEDEEKDDEAEVEEAEDTLDVKETEEVEETPDVVEAEETEEVEEVEEVEEPTVEEKIKELTDKLSELQSELDSLKNTVEDDVESEAEDTEDVEDVETEDEFTIDLFDEKFNKYCEENCEDIKDFKVEKIDEVDDGICVRGNCTNKKEESIHISFKMNKVVDCKGVQKYKVDESAKSTVGNFSLLTVTKNNLTECKLIKKLK